MNLFAGKGDIVTYSYPKNGHDHEKVLAAQVLELGKAYEVDHTTVYSSSSSLYLVDFPTLVVYRIIFEDYKVDEGQARRREIHSEVENNN